MREVSLDAVGDLLGTPTLDPATITAVGLVAASPGRTLRSKDLAVGRDDPPGKSFLDVVMQSLIGDELGSLRSTSH
jgi:hypothetical protein